MNKTQSWLLGLGLVATLGLASCSKKAEDSTAGQFTEKTATEDGYTYSYVEGDPLKARVYTLKNGLKIYLTVNKDEPRIQCAVAVATGSKNDPANATGLAHYLEHMVFKGTSKLGTADWTKEKPLLDSIEHLFETYRQTQDPAARKKLYEKIDHVSGEAAKYAIANEYDKLMSHVGAKGTNAFTWVDQTVYINDIPANNLEKWLKVESERFGELVPRLFHTELEAVYEEKNRGLDSDLDKVYENVVYPDDIDKQRKTYNDAQANLNSPDKQTNMPTE
jgi:predicted Zn-dependent peptidase